MAITAYLTALLVLPPRSEANREASAYQENPGGGGITSQTAEPVVTDKTVLLLNRGTKEDLQSKLGVGSDDAGKIINNRPYSHLNQLQRVVSKKTFKQIQKRSKELNPNE